VCFLQGSHYIFNNYVDQLRARISEPVQWHCWVQLPAQAEARGFSLLCDIQKDCWHHPVFYSVSTWGSFPAVEWLMCEADHTPTYTTYTPLHTFIAWNGQLQPFTFRLTSWSKSFYSKVSYVQFCFLEVWQHWYTACIETINGCKILSGESHRKISFGKGRHRQNEYRWTVGQ
jgi:hypothetical protein